MADGYQYPKTLGGQPNPVAASGRDGRLVSSFRGLYAAAWADVRVATPISAADRPLGNSVGAIGCPTCSSAASALGDRRSGVGCGWPLFLVTILASLGGLSGASCLRGQGVPGKIVIWLILPVVICLSQRLSHACLSISNLYSETANGLAYDGPFDRKQRASALRQRQSVGLQPAARSPWFNDYKAHGRDSGPG